jgi:hypothetical protein
LASFVCLLLLLGLKFIHNTGYWALMQPLSVASRLIPDSDNV